MSTKKLFKQLILDFHQSGLRPLKPRDLSLQLALNKVVVITGMRRVGKTSLLLNAIAELRKDLPVENILYINFEDERLSSNTETLDELLQAYRELYPDLNLAECYFFFDEIQEINGWEKFIRRLNDSISQHIFITGSNSRLLSSDIATALRGRSIRYELFPLSFAEFLRFKEVPHDCISSQGRARTIAAFRQYLEQGGFPELVFIDDDSIHTKIIQEYYDVMIFKDIVERYQESNLPALRYFLKRLIESIGSPLSINKVHNEMKSLGFRVGKNTLHDYFEITEAIYLSINSNKHDPSIVRQNMADKKSYVLDNSFLKHLTFRFNQDTGKLLENLIAVEIRRRQQEVFFIKGLTECDFIWQENIPMQVSVDISHPDTKAREIAGVIAGARHLNSQAGMIVTLDQEAEFYHEDVHITVIPAWQLLLS